MKKGFTLIELLAVILVLGIIALIAIPTVANIINIAKKKAIENSAHAVCKAYDYYVAKNKIEFGTRVEVRDLDLKHNDFLSGVVYSDSSNDVYLEDVSNNKYCINGKQGEFSIIKGSCDTNDPIINVISTETITEFIETDKNIKSYFNIDNNGTSKIKETICKIKDTDTIVNNIKDLSIGNYTIICTVSKENNRTASSEKNITIKAKNLVLFENGKSNIQFKAVDNSSAQIYPTGTFSISENTMNLYKYVVSSGGSSASWRTLLVATTNKVDITGFSKLYFKVDYIKLQSSSSTTYPGTSQFYYGILNSTGFNSYNFNDWIVKDFKASAQTKYATFTTAGTYVIDISGINKEVYVGMSAQGATWMEQLHDIKISKIWME